MSASSIARAANDPELQARVLAMAHKEIVFNEELAATQYGRQLTAGAAGPNPLMWPIAVDTEAAYETALLAGRGAPGHDTDIITDAALTSAVVAHWPADPAQ
jgi:hypothetical protein